MPESVPKINLKNIWKIGQSATLGLIKERLGKDSYIYKMVAEIKQIGRAILGKNIIAYAEYDGVLDKQHPIVTADDILGYYPPLGEAEKNGQITIEDIAEGTKRIKYITDHEGFVSATCFLPHVIKGGEHWQELPYGERIPIDRAVFKAIERETDEKTEVDRNRKIWRKVANIFQFTRSEIDRINDLESFLEFCNKAGKNVIPLRYTSKEYYFRVEEPSIDIRENVRPYGHINIQGVSLFVKDDHGSRVIVVYYIGRKWKEGWPLIQGIIREKEAAISRAIQVESDNVRNPYQGGRADGN